MMIKIRKRREVQLTVEKLNIYLNFFSKIKHVNEQQMSKFLYTNLKFSCKNTYIDGKEQ